MSPPVRLGSHLSDGESVTNGASLQAVDRVVTRTWELDLALAGKVYSPKVRPAHRKRQRIARFAGREGTVERFTFRQTMPNYGYEVFAPPTQAQYGAVLDFFLEPCESRYEASTLLCARDYAEAVAEGFRFTQARKEFIRLCTAAFILDDKELRSVTRTWNIAHRDRSPSSGTGAYLRCYRKVAKFASRLVDDMRGEGSEIFG